MFSSAELLRNMILQNFVESLSELIFQSNLSVKEFAEQLGCEKATIYRYLRGVKMPSVEMTVKMADFFACSTDYLLGLESDKYPRRFRACPPFHEQLPILLKS